MQPTLKKSSPIIETECNDCAQLESIASQRRVEKKKRKIYNNYVKVYHVWTSEEDEQLMRLVEFYGLGKWV